MNVQRILFPTDFSHYNDAALKLASSLAAETGAMLYIVHVHDSRDLNAAMGEASYSYASTWDDTWHEVQKRVKAVVPMIAGVSCQHECLVGNPVPEILRFAETHNIDLIVMASHGRSGLPRLLMGSVAEGIMRRARCPVLVVKQSIRDSQQRSAMAVHAAED